MRAAIKRLKRLGADGRLTEAVTLIDKAMDLFADWYEAEIEAGNELPKQQNDILPYDKETDRSVRYLMHYSRATRLGPDGKAQVHMSLPRDRCPHCGGGLDLAD